MIYANELVRLNKSSKKKKGKMKQEQENNFIARSCTKGCYKQINYAFSTYKHCVYAKPPNTDRPDYDRASDHVRNMKKLWQKK